MPRRLKDAREEIANKCAARIANGERSGWIRRDKLHVDTQCLLVGVVRKVAPCVWRGDHGVKEIGEQSGAESYVEEAGTGNAGARDRSERTITTVDPLSRLRSQLCNDRRGDLRRRALQQLA